MLFHSVSRRENFLLIPANRLAYVNRRIVVERMKIVSFDVKHLALRHSSNERVISINSIRPFVRESFLLNQPSRVSLIKPYPE